ncbi:hypothetical protein GC173_08240 [bacterium]|nr:hypothetical protein [bacterium]
MTEKLKIDGMTCGGCANRVAKALREVPGVATVQVSLEAGEAVVELASAVTPQTLVEAVTRKGYGATSVR